MCKGSLEWNLLPVSRCVSLSLFISGWGRSWSPQPLPQPKLPFYLPVGLYISNLIMLWSREQKL